MTPYHDITENKMTDTHTLQKVEKALEYLSPKDLGFTHTFRVQCALKLLGEDGEVLASRWLGKELSEVQKTFAGISKTLVPLKSIYALASKYGFSDNDALTLSQYTADITYRKRYVLPVDIKGLASKILCIKSLQGTGKTEAIKSIRSQLPDDTVILNIGHRRALLGNMSRRLGLHYYEDLELDHKGRYQQSQLKSGVSITLDSLPKLVKGKLPKVDVIILDEVCQVLRHLQGSTVRANRPEILSILMGLLRQARLIVALDADLSDLEVDFLRKVCPESRFTRILNEYQHSESITRYADKQDILMDAVNALQRGESCYIACNTRRGAEDVHSFLSKFVKQQGHTKLITARYTGEQSVKSFIANINNEVKGYQLIVTSPSLSTGVDIQYPVDNAYLIGDAFDGLMASDLVQTLWRCRNAGKYHSWVDGAVNWNTTDYTELMTVLVESGQILTDFDEEGNRHVVPWQNEELYAELWAKTKAVQNNSTNRLADNFYMALQVQGWEITQAISSEESDSVSEDYKAARKQRKQKEINEVLTAPDIDPATYMEYRKQENLTASEQYEYDKHHIKRNYAVDEVNEELVMRYADGRGIHHIYALDDLLNHDDGYLVESDKAEYRKVFGVDVKHRALKKKLREGVLVAAFGSVDAAFTGEFTDKSSLLKIEKFRKENGDFLRNTLGITGTGVYLLRAVAEQLGLSLKQGKQRGTGKGRYREYCLNPDMVKFMKDTLSRRESQRKEAQEQHADSEF